jgi:hypothetical protein
MAERNRYYAVGAVIRQLIECEYLLALFNEDLDYAKRWLESTPDEVRESFAPAKMRKLTGTFSNEEYWGHCSTGGHPAPKGARLLEKLDPRRQSWPYSAAEVATDLGLHLRRIWKAADSLLGKHHARYERVRADQRRQAEEAWTRWLEADPLVAALTGYQRQNSSHGLPRTSQQAWKACWESSSPSRATINGCSVQRNRHEDAPAREQISGVRRFARGAAAQRRAHSA